MSAGRVLCPPNRLGNEHGVIQGIGLVNCVYVNHEIGKFWVVDYRIYDPDRDGKTKIEHVTEMLQNLVYHKELPFTAVLMDSWYRICRNKKREGSSLNVEVPSINGGAINPPSFCQDQAPYATNKLMLYIDDLGKYYYCPLKRNRPRDDTGDKKDYQKIELLSWNESELKSGKTVKIKKFPGAKKVKLFRVTVSTNRTDFIATNDLSIGFYGRCTTSV